ncbi:MAG: FAD-dependent oxidoreductase [Planctomycetota bacterium]
MRIAVVGAGISGLTTAWLLSRRYEVTVFEREARIGGHTHTHDVERNGQRARVDTGFIVFNEENYPAFTRILRDLGVPSRATEMSFGVRVEASGLEYNATDLRRLFAQKRNLVQPRFWRMIRDLLRFYREAPAVLGDHAESRTLAEYLESEGYSEAFARDHLLPMGAALWSASTERIGDFPIRSIVEFFANHRMLQVEGRPQWRTIVGGSDSYLEPLCRPFADHIRRGIAVEGIRRFEDRVRVSWDGGGEDFDEVVIAAHSDQALRMLEDADAVERDILGAMPYQRNEVQLHTDPGVLPRRRLARAAWNYHLPVGEERSASVTYDMNALQGLPGPVDWLVTLNRREDVDPAAVLAEMVYHHPLFDRASVAAKGRFEELGARRRTHFCGAYWGHGFHEDGVRSALRVARRFGVELG